MLARTPVPLVRRVPMIEARGLCKSHRSGGMSVEVLKDATLTISAGEFVAIMGPSGSGKSTLLSLLGTLDAPTSGEVRIAGVATGALKPNALAAFRNARIGFVFQQFHLLGRTSALEQVQLPALYARGGTRRKDVEAAARKRLEQVGLSGYEAHKPSQLSGGQQQRVAIARALMNDPGLVLADEPTGALDERSGQEIMDLLCHLNDTGITVVIVTHDSAVARRAQRIIRMRDGRVAGDGPARGEEIELLRATA